MVLGLKKFSLWRGLCIECSYIPDLSQVFESYINKGCSICIFSSIFPFLKHKWNFKKSCCQKTAMYYKTYIPALLRVYNIDVQLDCLSFMSINKWILLLCALQYMCGNLFTLCTWVYSVHTRWQNKNHAEMNIKLLSKLSLQFSTYQHYMSHFVVLYYWTPTLSNFQTMPMWI